MSNNQASPKRYTYSSTSPCCEMVKVMDDDGMQEVANMLNRRQKDGWILDRIIEGCQHPGNGSGNWLSWRVDIYYFKYVQ